MNENNEYNKKEFQKKGKKAARSMEFENRHAEKRATCALRRARKEKEAWRRSA